MSTQPEIQIDYQAEMLCSKIKHYLITAIGVTVEEATLEEFYQAFSWTIRDEIMINWTATAHTINKGRVRKAYYLCMEYMPGRLLGNNISNLNAIDLVKRVLSKLGRNLNEIIFVEQDPGLGNGGMGRLASCLLDSIATQQYPVLSYGLRYQYGIFDQEIRDGFQIERPENWLLLDYPWELRRDVHSANIRYSGRLVSTFNKKGVEVHDLADYEEVRAFCYDIPIIGYRETHDFNVTTLRLWSTKDSPRNFELQSFNAGHMDPASENTSLTDLLYPNDNHELGKRFRLKQEYLLTSASLQNIIFHHLQVHPDMSNFADKVRIQINETHSALMIPELMRYLLKYYDYSWEEAWEVVKTCCSFTNHTVLYESLEQWNENRMQYLLPRQYQIIRRLNLEFCNSVRNKFSGDEARVQRMSFIERGQIKMAHLAIYGSHCINGVSKQHTELLKKMIFKDFYEMYPEKFVNVTNGVTQRRWLLYANPQLAEFISKKIGKSWLTDFSQVRDLALFASDPQSREEFLNIKKENKRRLIKFLRENHPIHDRDGKIIGHSSCLDEDALFDVQVKRFHEYKRQLMNALHLLMVYHELQEDPSCRKIKRMAIFAGKAAPGYEIAKNIIVFVNCLAKKINKDTKVNEKLQIAFIENYNVSMAEMIIPAAELSEQISTAGKEASGTGNMKLAINGALTICTEDGANIEMHEAVTDQWWPFKFGNNADQNAALYSSYNSWEIYMHNPAIKKAVDRLKDYSLAENEQEHNALQTLYQTLLETRYSEIPDRFFVLNDLLSYYETQKKVEDLYSNPHLWAEYAIHNIAAMGRFSTDETASNYAKLVWDLEKCPVDQSELQRVREEYSEQDKSRIFPQTKGFKK